MPHRSDTQNTHSGTWEFGIPALGGLLLILFAIKLLEGS